jgi:hypothetical protein
MRALSLFQLRIAGYGLLLIGVINLVLRAGFSASGIASASGRLSLAHGLAGFAPWLLLSLALIYVQGNRLRRRPEDLPLTLMQRLLLPLVVGYLLLIPLMVRDAVVFDRGLQGQINSQVAMFRSGGKQLQERLSPLNTPQEVVGVLRQYPNLSVQVDPSESVATIRQKLAKAIQSGEASLRERLEGLRRSRAEGLTQTTLQSSLICLVVALGMAALRLQNLALIQRSGHRPSNYFGQDLIPIRVRSGRGQGRRGRQGKFDQAFHQGWMAEDDAEPEVSGSARRS